MQEIRQDGSTGSVAVQIEGHGNTVTVSCGAIVLHLLGKHARRREIRSDLDLLRPETRLLDLLGREAEMASLSAWLDDERPVLVRGLTGRAGSGKTRLAIELGEIAAARGWQAGFLDSGDLAAFVDAQRTATWPRNVPMLVVVDYAARRARALNAWLHSLARRADPAKPRLRLLLLERHATRGEGWWDELLRLEGSDDALYDLLDPFEPLPLPPIDGIEQRRSLLRGVMAAWCRHNGRPILAPPAAGADPDFDRRLADPKLAAEPLHLMMAGLVAARHGLGTLLSLGRLDLALELACWERDRLAKLARDRGVSDRLLLHLVACVTLCRGLERAGLRALINQERAALPYERQVEREALADALLAALPAPPTGNAGHLAPLEPDIIGETFCLLILATNPDLDQNALIDRCRERRPARTAQHLVLTVQDFARPAEELMADVTQRSRRPEADLLPAWLGEANPALAWLDRLLAGTDDRDRLMAIANQIPTYTLLLRERGMLIDHRIVELLRPVARKAGNRKLMAMFAMALNNLGNRLSALGRREEALAATQEAVDLHRELVAEQPDAFRPEFAMALINLSNHLGELGQRDDALAAAAEAVGLTRKLAAERADAFRPNLASALTNYGASLNHLGRREALAATQEAVDLYRELTAERPDAFRHDLAGALHNYGVFLSALGRREEALAATQEAVDLHRELAAVRPDAFRPNLASALNNHGVFLNHLGRREAALAATQDAVDLYRELVAKRPDAFRPEFAMALINLANRLSALGQREAALAAAEEAARLYRELAAERPDAFQHDLAPSLAVLANCLEAAGRPAEALAVNGAAIEALREPFRALPGAFAHWMLPMVHLYFKRSEALSVEPDVALLAPILPVLMSSVEKMRKASAEREKA